MIESMTAKGVMVGQEAFFNMGSVYTGAERAVTDFYKGLVPKLFVQEVVEHFGASLHQQALYAFMIEVIEDFL